MVENSLQSLLDKYPYFLNKNEGSNFYKVVDVNNENFKDLYNSLFQVYESFHLRKKLLIWKEQSRPYDYSINFACYYPRIKSVTITKNDNLIYTNTYTKDENKSDFQFTYNCEYTITNSYRVIAYKCQDCDEIYFSKDTVRECSHCHSHNIEQTRIYKCDNCDEVYFTDNIPADCDNCNQNQFTEVNAYNCNVCGEIYFSTTLLQECPNCQTPYITKPSGTMYYDDPYININDNSMVITDNVEVEPLDNTSYVPTPQPPEDENESFPEPADGVEQIPENPYRVPIPIIPDDLFLITVETYDEYIVSKGFPENDKPTYDGKGRLIGDPFDHDYSLDEFGALNQIPRKEYIEVYNPELYNLTEPPFNNRLTEDDYHYMNRILEYNVRMWDTPAPVLEIWKLYGLPATLLNRERLLLKMFDETKHEFDEETGLVECWQPEPWEHKDKFCDGSKSLGEYFFVEADTIRPVLYQNVNITFKLLNSLAEEIDDDYLVDIYYYLEGDTCPEEPIRADFTDKNAIISHKLFKDNLDKTHVLRFVAHTSDNTIIGSEELLFNVRNCDDGDWYVSQDGDDTTGDGSITKPFKTLQKALSVVSKAMDLIIVKGNLTLSDEESIPVINTDCTIMGCDENASITSYYYREFFHLTGSKNVKIHLVNITLKNTELVSKIELVEFHNTNKEFYDYETVVIHGGAPILESTINNTTYYPYDNINVKGLLTSKEGLGLPNKKLEFLLGETKIDTITTNNDGTFDEWIHINQDYSEESQKFYLKFNHSDYFENTQEWGFNYKQPIKVIVRLGQNIRLTSTDHEPNDEVGFYYNDDNLIDTVTADSNGTATLTWNPLWGSYIVYTYKENIGEAVNAEWVVNTSISINELPTNEFVTGIQFKDNGDFELTTKTVSKISDMEGLLLDLTFNDDLRYAETVHVLPETYDETTLNSTELTPYEFEIFKQAIVDITVDDNGDLKLHRMDLS